MCYHQSQQRTKNQITVRKILLQEKLLKIIEEHYALHKDDEFVFSGTKPFADSNIGRVKEEACKKTEVKEIRIHDFSNNHAIYLFSKGITSMAVTKRLGHKDIKETFNTYSHMISTEEEKLLKVLDDQIG